MDIKVTQKSLRHFLKTDANLETIVNGLCQSGPTVDRINDIDDDQLLEIEVITNRIDCASVFGVAREANAILSQKGITSKLQNNPYDQEPIINHQTQKINLTIEDNTKVTRFLAVTIDGVQVKPSDQNNQKTLENIGQRSINNLVDLTNLYTYLYGYPSHIFDKDKLDLKQLTLRGAKSGESIKLLDDSKIDLQSGDLIIEDGSGNLVDLCCIMGGKHAVVDEHTKNILLIIPTCKPSQIRKTSLAHQKRTLAAQIFEKNPDSTLSHSVFMLLAKELIESTNAHFSSAILDINNQSKAQKQLELNFNWLNNFVGQEISKNEIISILNTLSFTTKGYEPSAESVLVSVPSFRADDINNQEDLAEEITRIYGYHNISPKFPELKSQSQPNDPIFNLEKKIRDILSVLGYTESLNSSLVSKKQIENLGQNPDQYLKLKNALSEDLMFMRTNLAISALQNHKNNKGQLTSPGFFEMGNVYAESSSKPTETAYLCLSNLSILDLKDTLNRLFGFLRLTNQIILKPIQVSPNFTNPDNTIGLFAADKFIGYLGNTNTQTILKAQLKEVVALAEINLQAISKLTPSTTYQEPSIYPEFIEDINITSDSPLSDIYQTVSTMPLVSKLTYLNSYKNKHTFRVHFCANDRNLTQNEIDKIKSEITKKFS